MSFQRYSLIIFIIPFFIGCASESINELPIVSEDDSLNIESLPTDSENPADTSEITCPACGFKALEELPKEYCLIKYECTSCGEIMHPEGNDCCVFCTHGNEKCPSKQD